MALSNENKISFLVNEPAIWFAQLEASFHEKDLNTQKQKFNHAVATLPSSIAVEVKDIILNQPAQNAYNILKAEIIKRNSVSKQQKMQQLLTTEVLGDRKPSQLLRNMRSLAGDTHDDGILSHLFLQRLPAWMQPILALCESRTLYRDVTAQVKNKNSSQTDT